MHKCVQLKVGHICQCKTGHKIARNGRDCIDINECDEIGRCSHKCQNTVGSFKCSCALGYAKDPALKNACRAIGMNVLVISYSRFCCKVIDHYLLFSVNQILGILSIMTHFERELLFAIDIAGLFALRDYRIIELR